MEWSALQSANQRLPSLWKKDRISDVRYFRSALETGISSCFVGMCYFFFLCLILQMYKDVQEHDDMAVLEEIQRELISQGSRQYQ